MSDATMTVTVRDRAAEARYWGRGLGGVILRTVTIAASCPRCGGPRGKPRVVRGCEDGEYYWVHTWDNPCGHVDDYPAVLAEARANGGSE